MACKLDFPQDSWIHLVFHDSCLKPKLGHNTIHSYSASCGQWRSALSWTGGCFARATIELRNSGYLGVGAVAGRVHRWCYLGGYLQATEPVPTPCGKGVLKGEGMLRISISAMIVLVACPAVYLCLCSGFLQFAASSSAVSRCAAVCYFLCCPTVLADLKVVY